MRSTSVLAVKYYTTLKDLGVTNSLNSFCPAVSDEKKFYNIRTDC